MKTKSLTLVLLSLILSPFFVFGDNHADEAAAAPAAEIVYDGSLDPNDFCGISFWLATAMMLAATVFFFIAVYPSAEEPYSILRAPRLWT